MADWFAMNGHGLYIWGSFGVAALFMVVEPILVRASHRTLRARLSRMIRMNAGGEEV